MLVDIVDAVGVGGSGQRGLCTVPVPAEDQCVRQIEDGHAQPGSGADPAAVLTRLAGRVGRGARVDGEQHVGHIDQSQGRPVRIVGPFGDTDGMFVVGEGLLRRFAVARKTPRMENSRASSPPSTSRAWPSCNASEVSESAVGVARSLPRCRPDRTGPGRCRGRVPGAAPARPRSAGPGLGLPALLAQRPPGERPGAGRVPVPSGRGMSCGRPVGVAPAPRRCRPRAGPPPRRPPTTPRPCTDGAPSGPRRLVAPMVGRAAPGSSIRRGGCGVVGRRAAGRSRIVEPVAPPRASAAIASDRICPASGSSGTAANASR